MIQFSACGCLRFSQTGSHSSSFSTCIVGSLVSFNVKAKDNWTQGISRKNVIWLKRKKQWLFTFPVIRSCLLAGCRNLLLNLNNRGHTRVFARIGSHCSRCLGWHDLLMTLLSSARVGVYVQVVVCFFGCVGEKTRDTYFWKTLISEYVKRVIVHPSFKNISFKEAERLLAEMEQGECIVRPSSKVRSLS